MLISTFFCFKYRDLINMRDLSCSSYTSKHKRNAHVRKHSQHWDTSKSFTALIPRKLTGEKHCLQSSKGTEMTEGWNILAHPNKSMRCYSQWRLWELCECFTDWCILGKLTLAARCFENFFFSFCFSSQLFFLPFTCKNPPSALS